MLTRFFVPYQHSIELFLKYVWYLQIKRYLWDMRNATKLLEDKCLLINEQKETMIIQQKEIEVLNGYVKEYQILCDKKDEIIDSLMKTLNEKN